MGNYLEAKKAFNRVKEIDSKFLVTLEEYDKVEKALNCEQKAGVLLDDEIAKVAVRLATKKRNTIPLRIVADETGLPIVDVFKALSKSQAGELETYGKDDLNFYVFFLRQPSKQPISNPEQTKERKSTMRDQK